MENIKTLEFINGDRLYLNKVIEIRDNGEDVEYYEVDTEAKTEAKIPTKIIKWLAESGRLDPRELVDFMDVKVPVKVVVVEKAKKVVKDAYEGEMVYKGKSKKIESKVVTVLSDNGTKCKVQDSKGTIVVVAKSTLTKLK